MSDSPKYTSLERSVIASLANRMVSAKYVGNRIEFDSAKAQLAEILAGLMNTSPDLIREYEHFLEVTLSDGEA